MQAARMNQMACAASRMLVLLAFRSEAATDVLRDVIDPELGRIGMTETQARKAGRKIKVAKMPMDSVARAVESAETRGFLKAVVDAETDQILGAAILGVDGGEIAAPSGLAAMLLSSRTVYW